MDQPGRKVSGKDLASTLDIPNGASGVAGVLAWPARHCAAVNRVGPWRWEYRSEVDGAYYWIDPEVADLFKKVRNLPHANDPGWLLPPRVTCWSNFPCVAGRIQIAC
jgi:hypothetical protein